MNNSRDENITPEWKIRDLRKEEKAKENISGEALSSLLTTVLYVAQVPEIKGTKIGEIIDEFIKETVKATNLWAKAKVLALEEGQMSSKEKSDMDLGSFDWDIHKKELLHKKETLTDEQYNEFIKYVKLHQDASSQHIPFANLKYRIEMYKNNGRL